MQAEHPPHIRHWPPGLPRSLRAPAGLRLHDMLENAARRDPAKPLLHFEDRSLSYGDALAQVERLAGFLQHACGVQRGDRVLLDMQNSADFVIACFAILRADAVVVPLSPMNVASELAHYAADSGATVALTSADLADRFDGIARALVPGRDDFGGHDPAPSLSATGDLAMLPYTSGSTGKPKGCMHTHDSVMHNVVGAAAWKRITAGTVALATAPFFHVTGLVHSFLATVYAGGTMAIQQRWDPLAAARIVERYRCTHWDNVPTMVVDLLSHPGALQHDVSSLRSIFGGGAAMPEAIAQKLFDICGVHYVEGYGMTETISQTHMNPPQRPKKQCLGIPTFDTESLVIDPDTFKPLAPGEPGEIVVRGPQLLCGYWQNEAAFRESWVDVDGKAYFRTGDLGRMDEDGYFFIADRLKRMINAAGYKVWPAEVEATMYRHPAIKECCIIAAPDARRGETVKAVVVLKPGAAASGEEILAWARKEMAAYKAPRLIEFSAALPRTPSGKLMWRALQEKEFA
ncbi:MAG: AMP-binding protein [Burkholderiales bacterium]